MPGTPDILGHGTSYVLLVIALFIGSQVLERWRIPSAITSLLLGAGMAMGFGWFIDDPVISLLSTLGIVALFLFAGLEVDLVLLREERQTILEHIAMRLVGLALLAVLAWWVLGLGPRAAVLFSLALLTPSTGFILSALRGFGLTADQQRDVKSHAIASEIVALVVLFLVLRSSNGISLLTGLLALAAMAVVVPLLFRWLRSWLIDKGLRAEFAFLVVLSVTCASITKALGAYYLLGAFLAGLIAQRTRLKYPGLVSERLVESVEVFAVFFIPFYFLRAGLELRAESLTIAAVVTGVVIFIAIRPLWLLLVAALRRRHHREEPLAKSMRVGWALMPTLVFTLVIAQILRDEFALDPILFGSLIVYTLLTTVVPVIMLGLPSKSLDYMTPEAMDPPYAAEAATAPATTPPPAEPAQPPSGQR
jgi:Kef-type K+ transport system membrane component KefB